MVATPNPSHLAGIDGDDACTSASLVTGGAASIYSQVDGLMYGSFGLANGGWYFTNGPTVRLTLNVHNGNQNLQCSGIGPDFPKICEFSETGSINQTWHCA
ncbi:hypothetical protein LTR17_017802 [Elasticomyces elasticus]|nr:hypothetical protein LTR17_017802 [Elasticomyces elasticus]